MNLLLLLRLGRRTKFLLPLFVILLVGFTAPQVKKGSKPKVKKFVIQIEEEVPLHVIAKDPYVKALIKKTITKKKRIKIKKYYPASFKPRKTLRVSVLADDTDYAPGIENDDIEQTFEFASETLRPRTGWVYRIIDIQHGGYPRENIRESMADYLEERIASGSELPDYVVLFAKDEESLSFGGYAEGPFGVSPSEYTLLRERDPHFCNRAGSPYDLPGVIYLTVIDWHHLLGGCGYDRRGDLLLHLRSTSSGGECRGVDGLECLHLYGEWQCPNLVNDPDYLPFLEDRRLFTAQTINHELLHNFGGLGNEDHRCGEGVPEEIALLSAFNICGTTIRFLSEADENCAGDPRPLGIQCSEGDECQSGFCHSFRDPETSDFRRRCSHDCDNGEDCPSREGWRVDCIDLLDRSDVSRKGCYYFP